MGFATNMHQPNPFDGGNFNQFATNQPPQVRFVGGGPKHNPFGNSDDNMPDFLKKTNSQNENVAKKMDVRNINSDNFTLGNAYSAGNSGGSN